MIWWLSKELAFDLTSSVRPIDSWDICHWEYPCHTTEDHNVPLCDHFTNERHNISITDFIEHYC